MASPPHNTDYNRISVAIDFLDQHAEQQPGLGALAGHLGLSKFHMQRLFCRWAGVSPKQFLQLVTLGHAKRLLDRNMSVLDAACEVGLSGPGRLHDHFITIDAMTPGQYKASGAGLVIEWALQDSPFGRMFLARTPRGICKLAFVDNSASAELADLRQQWPAASICENSVALTATAAEIFSGAPAQQRLSVRGTNFQVKVWQALLKIPTGEVASYQGLARYIERPNSYRAVANAIAANPVAYLIPCHRVLRSSGALGGYRWGMTRKRAMLVWEAPEPLPGAPD